MPKLRTIQELRQAAGMTQQELANRLGVAGSTVYKWESGRQEPGAVAFRDIARALKADMRYIDLRPFEKERTPPGRDA